MNIVVCGTRHLTDRHPAMAVGAMVWGIDQQRQQAGRSPVTVLHGAQRGADKLIADSCKQLGLPVIPFPAAWRTHERSGPVPCRCPETLTTCKAAGPRRNETMASRLTPGDLAVALTYDVALSRGTRDMLARAEARGARTLTIAPSPMPTADAVSTATSG